MLAATVQAHQTKLSSSRLLVEGSKVDAMLELNGIDLNVAAQLSLTGEGDQVVPERLAAERERVFGYVLERVRLEQGDGTQCRAVPGVLEAKADHVVIGIEFLCPAASGKLEYRVVLFHEVDPASRHMVTVEADRNWIGLLGSANPVLSIGQEEPALGATLWRYFLSGVEHIAIGYDHIAFLLAVIVLARSFWPLFAVVTAFTVAHSITLSLAVLDVVTLPSRLVEAAIAASIVYVAAENFFVKDIRRRWWITFVFGLIHGFGFASVLREYGIPENAVVPALASFNIGVEAGQLLIVAIAAAIWKAGLKVAEASGVKPTESLQRKVGLIVSALVLALGLYWLIERLMD
jgi:hydrogenase/urease accessory protein HupE